MRDYVTSDENSTDEVSLLDVGLIAWQQVFAHPLTIVSSSISIKPGYGRNLFLNRLSTGSSSASWF
jgi:hypothetical protein